MDDQGPVEGGEPPPESSAIASRLRELELTIASLADLVVVLDRRGLVVECNGATEKVWGLSASEVLGQPLPTASGRLEMVDRDGRASPLAGEPTVRALSTRRPERIPLLGLRRADGTLSWVRVTAIPVLDGLGEPRVISVWTDVTAATTQEGDLGRYTRELERRVEERTATLEATIAELDGTNAELAATVTRLEAAVADVGAFSYSVSHDLRTPVRSISALAETLRDEIGEGGSPGARDLVDRIHRAALRMDALIATVLQFSTAARDDLQRVPIDVSELAHEGSRRLAENFPDRLVECIVEDGMVGYGDPRLIGVVLDNLLANAWKFTAFADRPRVEVGTRTPDGPGGGPVYYVRDNGIGFDMADADDLFVPFRRLPSAGEFEGSGVGLAIVQRIVARHGGRLWAESVPDHGATFYFLLPNAS